MENFIFYAVKVITKQVSYNLKYLWIGLTQTNNAWN